MKTRFHYLSILMTLVLWSFTIDFSDKIIELPFTLVDGYGAFSVGFGVLGKGVTEDNPWSRTIDQDLKGIPTDWNNIVTNYIWFDPHQFAYQNYKQGKLNEEFFTDLKSSWNINLDKRPFSEKPIKCFVYVIYGKDSNGVTKYKIDTNNNLDFSDETEYSPVLADWKQLDSLAGNFSHKVKYQSFRDGKPVELFAPLLIVTRGNGTLLRNIPQYGETELNGTKIQICSQGFNSTDYEPASILKLNNKGEIINEKEFILINSDLYQNLGVDINQQVLRLKKLPKDTIIYSSQVGFNAMPFTAKEFSTQETISLHSYQGKYLYLEFWGSWCGPCLKELPEIKRAYHNIDKSKIDFLGVAFDNVDPLKKILEKEKIEWSQILQEEEGGIIDDYTITGYPTSFLIDPNGKIIAKNVRGEKLLDTLNYYAKKR